MKKFILLLAVIGLFTTSCEKKNETVSSSPDKELTWAEKKTLIENKVEADLKSMKVLLPTIIKNGNGYSQININSIDKFFGTVPNSSKDFITVTRPGGSTQQVTDLTGPANPGDPTGPPLVAPYSIDFYREMYKVVCQNYTTLADFITDVDEIENEALGEIHVSNDDKIQLTWEISYLKKYATDLETNPDWWLNLDQYSVGDVIVTPSGDTTIIGDPTLAPSNSKIIAPVLKVTKLNCKIDMRGCLAGAVIGGVYGAYKGATAGAVAGTAIPVPGAGTVTGALAGGVVGFAGGFVGGFVTSALGCLLTTCFRK